MRKRKLLLRGFPIWLFVLSLLFVGNTSVFGQKAKLSKDQLNKLIKEAYNTKPVTKGAKADIIYEQNFNGDFPPTDWTLITTGAGFTQVDFGEGDKAAAHFDNSGAQNDWLVSAGIELPSDLPSILDFDEYIHFGSWMGFHGVFISENADMTNSVLLYNGTVGQDDWYSQTINIDSYYKGKTVYFGFNYQGNYSDLWFIDNFVITKFDGPFYNYFESFSFDFMGVPGVIDQTDRTILAVVPYDTDVDTLTAFFTTSLASEVKVGSTEQESGVTNGNDFTNPVVYTVASYKGVTRDYTVTVEKADPLLTFSLQNALYTHRYNDTIEVVYAANYDLTSQVVAFTMYDIDYDLKAGAIVLESGTTAINVSSNVVLTAEAGDYTKTYTLIVSQENPLTTFNFIGYNNADDVYVGFHVPVVGEINLEALTIDLVVPYGTPMTELIATYGIESYVNSIEFESTELVSGTTPEDYSSGGDLVLAFDAPAKATGLTYVVTVTEGDPSEDNNILTVSIEDLADDLVWDRYGRKIEGELKYDSTKNVLPVLTISPLATVDATSVPFDMPASGDTTIVYKVKSESGNIAVWQLMLTVQEPSDKAELTDFAFGGQIKGWFIDTLLLNTVSADSNLASLKVTELEVSFGAIITPSAVSPTTTNFTDAVTYTVTAQDGVAKTEYAAYVFKEETVAPVVTLTAGTFGNYKDSVEVKITDASLLLGGWFGLFHKDVDVAAVIGDDDAMEQAQEDGKIVLMEIPDGTTDGTFYVPTDNLIAGIFYAYAGDYFDNISAASADSAVMVVDTVEVSTIAEMTMMNVVYKYVGEAVVTYAQSYRHQKHVQDTSMGILIFDYSEYVSDTVVIGDAITNIYGKLDEYYGTWELKPISVTKDSARIVSRGNEVVPLELTVEQFNSSIYTNQNMLVKLTNMSFTQADSSNYFTNGAIYDIQDNATGDMTNFRTSFYDVDYIGDTIPYGVYDIVGIKNVRNDGPVLTARNYADLMEVAGYKYSIDPEKWEVSMIGIANDMKSFKISNNGPEPLTIANAYIEGAPEFNMVNIYDVEVGAYSEITFDVNFEPANFGTYESVLKVMLTSGDIYEVALTASVSDVPVVDYPYATDFNTEEAIAGWVVDNMGTGAGFQWGNGGLSDTYSMYRTGYNNPSYPDNDLVMLVSPPIDMTNAVAPVLEWNNLMINAQYGFAYCDIRVSIDNQQTWTIIAQVVTNNLSDAGVVLPPTPLEFDISDYAGESKVQFAFYINEPSGLNGSPVTWWDIDDFAIVESPTMPVFVINTDSIGMGVVDGTYSFPLTIANEGASYFTLNSVTLKTGGSAAFTLANVPTEAVEVYEQDITVNVNFDGTLDMQEATIVVSYTDVRMGDSIVEIPVSAMGVGCAAPVAAVVGENTAPYAPVWYEFTPTNDALITISSCGDVVDTDLKVYDACDGNLIAANDDNGDCGNNEYASAVTFAAKGGNAYKINWLATWDASGFVWTLTSVDLPTGPELVSVTATALNAEKAQAMLAFKEMAQINTETKGHSAITSGINVNLITDRISVDELVKFEVSNSKDFTPDGDDEEEPNNGPSSIGGDDTFTEITLGTEDAPKKITGLFGASGDPWDWFTVTLTEPTYIHAECDIAEGNVYFWVINAEFSGTRLDVLPDETGRIDSRLFDVGTYYIIVQPRVSADDPGIAYNVRAWGSQPPTFSVYRDMMKIAGPVPMAFTYTDKTLNIDQEYCYTVTQELYSGSESDFSNSMCATAVAGVGDICTLSVEVEAGEVQTAPKTPYWYAYTPTEPYVLTITSDIEENGDPSEDWNDTMLEIYANCDDETPIYENDDSGAGRLSELTFPVEAGVTYLVHWKRWAPEGEDNAYNDQPFFFSIIEEASLEGDLVETAFPVELPLVNFEGTTDGFNDDYSATDCGNVFMGEKDVCYTFTLPYGGTISGGITGSYAGMHVIKGVPGNDACFAFAEGADGGTFTDQAIDAGTYYIVVDHKLPFDSAEFVMNLSFTIGDKQTVTFNVDMNTQITLGNFNAAVDTVDIVGTFSYWEHAADLTDDDGDGVYTYDLPTEFFSGEELRYKYRINHDWDNAELSNDIDVYREWTVLAENNVTNDLYDNVETPTYNVTFKVVMSKQIELENFDPAVDTLGITASVSGNVPELVDVDGTFIYETTVSADYGEDVTYVFSINATDEESGDRTTGAVTEDMVITVWYNNVSLVGVDYDLASNLSIYPNPATDYLTVDFGIANTANTVIKVVDISGQVVKIIDLNNRTTVNIDVADFAKGVYYLRITDGESVSIQKVVVQ